MNAHTFLLFDGAQLRQLGVSETHALPGECFLYANLGHHAQRVGPLLAPVSDEAEALARQCDSKDDVFAVARLQSTMDLAAVASHLGRLRFVQTQAARRYYFRYADHRALLSTWEALLPEQRAALLGPITQWDVRDIDRAPIILCPPADAAATIHGTSWPLTLAPSQFAAVLERTRPGELLSATAEAYPELAAAASYAQRHQWSQRTYAWLRQRGYEIGLLALAVNAAVWRSAGQALSMERFAARVQHAAETDRLDMLDCWPHDDDPA